MPTQISMTLQLAAATLCFVKLSVSGRRKGVGSTSPSWIRYNGSSLERIQSQNAYDDNKSAHQEDSDQCISLVSGEVKLIEHLKR